MERLLVQNLFCNIYLSPTSSSKLVEIGLGTGKLLTFNHRKIVKHQYSKIVKNPYGEIVNFFANKFIAS